MASVAASKRVVVKIERILKIYCSFSKVGASHKATAVFLIFHKTAIFD